MQRESVDKKKTTQKRTSPPVEEEDNGAAGFLPDLLRRGLTLGFTGFFLTEEAVRKALGESVPRDLMDFILAQSERTRAEFLDRISKEFARTLSTLDPVEVVKRLLEGRSIEVSATIRLVATDTAKGGRGVKLSVKGPEETE
jgi:hypothetical protein